MAQRVVVIGGGLSGLSAAHTVLEKGFNVVVIDRNSFMGGNSTKATSGINGAGTQTQKGLKIEDTVQAFYDDTAKSAKTGLRPNLVKVLTGDSGPAVDWLQTNFNLDLSLVSRLGGHSFPRTHRGKERFPGMTITYALMEKLEEIAKSTPERAQIITKARATRLLTNSQTNQVEGVEYEKDGQVHQERGPVILATGGYAADFSDDSLLKKYRPDLLHLPTTNGDHCVGDGIKMSQAIGGNAIDMKNVQVHPTGLVDPNEPDAKIKFLAAEALRGVGGLLLTNKGERFCDELGTRDYVTGEMWKHKAGPYRLVLNSSGSKEIEWHCKHYTGRGLMKPFKNGAALAAEMGIPAEKLAQTFEAYNKIGVDGGKTNPDPYGKKYFTHMPFRMDDSFNVAIVTPVLHYCMGGIEADEFSRVISTDGKAITGLYACGEIMGGVHGVNRLGGSSLLDCVVFGRVAGASAAKQLTSEGAQGGNNNQGVRVEERNGGGNRIVITIHWGDNNQVSGSYSSGGKL
eukprot:TRINITY_DN1141_c0_g1_i1.p1 TRINITY_DN1141_c0_g1~~TRINITY_DN1141_c0_g1_i1.p1  ORF type:complete len:514 (-),score=178.63 TRINITY_DN1141_c0_g1_i1:90-1631(-)